MRLRLAITTLTKAGTTLPAFSIFTVPLLRMSFRQMHFSLWSVAKLMVLSARKTGSSVATGVSHHLVNSQGPIVEATKKEVAGQLAATFTVNVCGRNAAR